MSPNLNVKNDTSGDILCKVYPIGFEEASEENLIKSNSAHLFIFKSMYSKTYIVSVDGKATRVVSAGKVVCLKMLSDGLLVITVEDFGSGIMASSKELIENNEVNMNWNAISDESAKYNSNKKVTGDLRLLIDLNKHISTVFESMVGLMVPNVTSDKDAAKMITKVSTDFFNDYLKVTIPLLKETEDPAVMFKLDDIRQTLVAISRTVSFGYPYYRESIGSQDSNLLIGYLQDLLSKVTATNIFPFLEECSLEIAVSIYVFGISIVQNILAMIREITSKGLTEAELAYIKVFVNNLKVMWDNVIERFESNIKTKVKGCFVKKAKLLYKGQLIYYVKSCWRSRIKKRIEDVRNEFIKSRKYQLEFLFNHPSDFVKRFEEMSIEEQN